MSDGSVRDTVREGYAEIARTGAWNKETPDERADDACCGGGGCCGPTTLSVDDVARAIGYSDDELARTPDGANLGLSCGNPGAIAQLREGETVLDLGSGAGFDCFLAGPRVGATGRVIGVDMTPEMLTRARANLGAYRERSGLDNVEFRLGEIEHLPVADGSVDAVISNCVINLSADKGAVWREIARVLRPGGRVAVSDLALLKPLPASVRDDAEALVGCVAGAQLVDDVRACAESAGLGGVTLEASGEYVRAFIDSGDPLYARIAERLPGGETLAAYVVSLSVTGTKPGGCCAGDGCC
ncbi:MAG: arsenite methyltransferase [Planctomycetota bacterium]